MKKQTILWIGGLALMLATLGVAYTYAAPNLSNNPAPTTPEKAYEQGFELRILHNCMDKNHKSSLSSPRSYQRLRDNITADYNDSMLNSTHPRDFVEGYRAGKGIFEC